MTFNSIEYGVFLLVVLGLYWALRKSVSHQNVLLLIASYTFYGFWDYRFLSLLLISTAADFLIGRGLGSTDIERSRKRLLAASLVINLGILGFFKYFDFFVGSAASLLESVGLEPHLPVLSIVLPVGISFYTFQTLSYTFDVYRRRMEPTLNFLDFAVYVSFFPQLVAGPIERARRLLPQIAQPRTITFDRFKSGLGLILLGLFKKVAIADVMAGIANDVFATASTAGTAALLIGVYAFSLQIYGDFSGYTDIARGSARLFGLDLMHNFRQPYLSRSITEFWRTWHISLSTWLRDYLYIPLGGNRHGSFNTYRNLMITMLLGGLWHGASWTFVVWGGMHGLYLAIHKAIRGRPDSEPDRWRIRDVGATVLVFHLVALTWVFFRSPSLTEALLYFQGLLGRAGEVQETWIALLIPATLAVVAIDLLQRNSERELFFLTWKPVYRGITYAILVFAVVLFSGGQPTPFIYFQF